MRLDQLLSDFARRHRLSPIAPDDQGQYALTLDGDLEVSIVPRTAELALLTAEIGPMPPHETPDGEELFRRMLQSLFARMATHSEILALTKDGAPLVQFRPLALARLSVDEFETRLAEFVSALEFWRGFLTRVPVSTFMNTPMMMVFP